MFGDFTIIKQAGNNVIKDIVLNILWEISNSWREIHKPQLIYIYSWITGNCNQEVAINTNRERKICITFTTKTIFLTKNCMLQANFKMLNIYALASFSIEIRKFIVPWEQQKHFLHKTTCALYFKRYIKVNYTKRIRDTPLDFKGGAGSLGQDKFFFPSAWQGRFFFIIFST